METVKAKDFHYTRAKSLAEALDLLGRHGPDARVIAGGQSLVPALNLRLAAPGHLIDINALEELRGIRLKTADGVRRLFIGALVRHAEIERSALVADCAPLLQLAVKHVAHAAIRNRGTFGGSLAHADPSAEFPACVLALSGRIHIAGSQGVRVVAATDFFLGLHETAVASDEILVGVEIDAIEDGYECGFAELARRGGDYALVGLALVGRPEPVRNRFERISIAFFSVGDRPLLAHNAAKVLCDATIPDDDRIRLAQQAIGLDFDPPGDVQVSSAGRLHLARVLLGRVAGDVANRRRPS